MVNIGKIGLFRFALAALLDVADVGGGSPVVVDADAGPEGAGEAIVIGGRELRVIALERGDRGEQAAAGGVKGLDGQVKVGQGNLGRRVVLGADGVSELDVEVENAVDLGRAVCIQVAGNKTLQKLQGAVPGNPVLQVGNAGLDEDLRKTCGNGKRLKVFVVERNTVE